MQTFKKLILLLNSKERNQAAILIVMILIMAILDTIGVASILPFVAVLTNPNIIDTNLFLGSIFNFSKIFGVENHEEFLFALGIFVFILLVISLIFKVFTTYFQVRFVQLREYSIGKLLIEGYLRQPYSWFLSRHSADLGKTILSEVQHVVANGINPMMQLFAQGFVAISLITLLFITDPKLALVVGLILSIAYGLIFFFSRKYLDRIGKISLLNNQLRFTTVTEAFGAAKEIKVSGLEQSYIKRFSSPARNFAISHASSQVIAQLPRFVLEAIAFGGIMLIILYMMSKTGSFNNSLPIISLYVFAGYRLMPALQQIYASLTQLSFVGPSIDKLNDDVRNIKPLSLNNFKGIVSLNKKIILNNVYYNYPNSSRVALKNINLTIPAKTTVGFMGATGSGKTTTVDIILGLLEPQKGNLKIDDQIITYQNLRAWQRSIGYVPQQIFLTDDTIAANIAHGIEQKNIDQKAVEKASVIANLHEFVVNELPNQYQTKIGERGIRLSGGQRQRIGIARALYHNPQVLILDEATSALDTVTEKEVMDAVNNLRNDITIIIISHRLSTLRECDKIFQLDKGELKTEGKYDELINVNKKLIV